MTLLIVDVEQNGITSDHIEAPFDKAKSELEKEGYRIISLEENAKLRMREGKDSYVSRNGNWVKEGMIYLHGRKIHLTKNSPIMDNPVEATNCHRNGQEYNIIKEQIEKALADSFKFEKTGDYTIPTNRFGEDPLTVYIFGEKTAEDYGNFLRQEVNIKKMPVSFVDGKINKPFARQVWFRYLGDWSGLIGFDWNLGCNYRARGVRGEFVNAEGGQKISDNYSIKDIQKVLKEKDLSGIEEIVIDGLKQLRQ